jgi:hypothetical protein
LKKFSSIWPLCKTAFAAHTGGCLGKKANLPARSRFGKGRRSRMDKGAENFQKVFLRRVLGDYLQNRIIEVIF